MNKDVKDRKPPGRSPIHPDPLPATCVCGHAEEWHQVGGEWCEGPCEHEGCPCPRYRLCAEPEEETDGL